MVWQDREPTIGLHPEGGTGHGQHRQRRPKYRQHFGDFVTGQARHHEIGE